MSGMSQERAPQILQIFREFLKAGSEAAYKTIEDDSARICVRLKCPHPHLAIESLTGPREVWWLNAFESDSQRQQVDAEYAKNVALMSALERNSERKQEVTGTPINVYAHYRSDLSRDAAWTLAGARFLVVTITRQEVIAEGSAFEASDGVRFILRPVATRQQADVEWAAAGQEARIFAVRPYWGLPEEKWIEADPEFWKANPIASGK